MIDLRSDTVTRPSRAMREAMARAEVGDDGYGEDPTVTALEEEVAARFGQPAAVFVPSGHMANLVAVAAQTEPGDRLVVDPMSHIARSELGWPEKITGLEVVPGTDPAGARLACLEQTQMHRGGLVLPLSVFDRFRESGARVHCDGARVWNAAVASGCPLHDYGARVDSISVCFSKGLGAPVGSAVAAAEDTVERARHWRHLLGGRMRQAGVLAAAARFAMAHHLDRLAEDHEHAAELGSALAEWVTVPVETNIVFLEVPGRAEAVTRGAGEAGVLVRPFGADRIRLVTHLDVGRDQVRSAAATLARLLSR